MKTKDKLKEEKRKDKKIILWEVNSFPAIVYEEDYRMKPNVNTKSTKKWKGKKSQRFKKQEMQELIFKMQFPLKKLLLCG